MVVVVFTRVLVDELSLIVLGCTTMTTVEVLVAKLVLVVVVVLEVLVLFELVVATKLSVVLLVMVWVERVMV